jgi:hypothetical protein
MPEISLPVHPHELKIADDDDVENQRKHHRHNHNHEFDYYSFCIKAIIIFLLTATAVPFIVCDFYFSLHKPYSCQLDKSKYMTTLRLNIWLLVSAIGTSITYVSTFCILASVSVTKEAKLTKKEDFYARLLLLVRYTSLIWLIVGAVLFWRDVEPQHNCSKSFTNYMYTKLIMGFISFFFHERNSNKNSDRQVADL